MKTQEEFLECEIEEFESPEYQDEFKLLSDARRNDILFKRLLFDYDEDLPESLDKFIRSNGKTPAWAEMVLAFPELKYVYHEDQSPLTIAKIVKKEITIP
ncbi:MAG: hypothetical protein MUC31_00705 [Bacteroidales bacterium]|jgi:hypothetical protein|nr:hypothetical protein [Bacteroidales bacterium]